MKIKEWFREKLRSIIWWACGKDFGFLIANQQSFERKLMDDHYQVDKLKKQWEDRWVDTYQNGIKLLEQFEGMKAHCAVDHHMKEPSWAVIHISDEKHGFLKFIRLNNVDIHSTIQFLRQYEYVDIDTTPLAYPHIIGALKYDFDPQWDYNPRKPR